MRSAVLTLAVMLLSAYSVSANAETLAILDLEGDGPLAEDASLCTRWVREALLRQGWQIQPADLTTAEARLSFFCMDARAECWAEVGRSLETPHLIAGDVSKASDQLQLQLIFVDVLQRRIRGTLTVAGDGVQELRSPLDEFVRAHATAQAALLTFRNLPAGAQITVNGAPASPVAGVLPLPSGSHRIEVELAGHLPFHDRVALRAGQRSTFEVGRLTPLPAPPAAPRTPPSYRSPVGWALLGTGTVAVGIGGVFGILAVDAQQEYDEPNLPEARAHTLRDRGERNASVANALYGIGAALVASGATLLLTATEDP